MEPARLSGVHFEDCNAEHFNAEPRRYAFDYCTGCSRSRLWRYSGAAVGIAKVVFFVPSCCLLMVIAAACAAVLAALVVGTLGRSIMLWGAPRDDPAALSYWDQAGLRALRSQKADAQILAAIPIMSLCWVVSLPRFFRKV